MKYLPRDLMIMARHEARRRGRDLERAIKGLRRSSKGFRRQLDSATPNSQSDVYFRFLCNLGLQLSGCSSHVELTERMKERAEDLGLFSRDVAARSCPKISKSTVNRVFGGQGVPRLMTVCGIAAAVGLRLVVASRHDDARPTRTKAKRADRRPSPAGRRFDDDTRPASTDAVP